RMIKEGLRRRMHQPIPVQGKWLRQTANGYFNYHAVPTNIRSLVAFRTHVSPSTGSARSGGAARRIGPTGYGSSGWPSNGSRNRKSVILGQSNASPSDTQGGSRMPESGSYGSVRGALSNERPYRDKNGPSAAPANRAG